MMRLAAAISYLLDDVPFERRFETAANGTIFLDEIGDLDAALQSKLLRVLEDFVYERVGGSRSLPMSARVNDSELADVLSSGIIVLHESQQCPCFFHLRDFSANFVQASRADRTPDGISVSPRFIQRTLMIEVGFSL